MKRSQAFPSRYMSKDDAENPIQLTISDVRFETIKTDHGDEDKAVMFFRGDHKPMILNNTNWEAVEDSFGPESDDWKGKTVELYVDPGVMFGNKRVGGVRLRIPGGGATVGAKPDLSFDQAIALCAEVGITKEELVAHLKGNGLTAYNAVSATAHVRAMIETKRADNLAQVQDEQIPF